MNLEFRIWNSKDLRALRFFLCAYLIDHHRKVARNCLNHRHQTLGLRVDEKQHLRDEFFTRRQASDRFNLFQFDDLALNQADFEAEDIRICFGEFRNRLRESHRIAGAQRHGGDALEMIRHRLERSPSGSLASQGVLNHFIGNASFAQLATKFLVLRDRHLLKTDQHCGVRLLELFSEGVEVFLFLCFCFHFPLLTYLANSVSSSRMPGLIVEARLTFFMYLPLAVDGFAFATASSTARVFSTILISSNETLPTPV